MAVMQGTWPRTGATHPSRVPDDVLEALHKAETETTNLMEQIAMDMSLHLGYLFPDLARDAGQLSGLRLVERMRVAGRILLENVGEEIFQDAPTWRSDTARGWAAMAVGDVPGLALAQRLELSRPFAVDPHFAVREWAWLGIRRHICADPVDALTKLEPWCRHESPSLRRFASEATRPIGVWSSHIPMLKKKPELAERLLCTLVPDASRYVNTSVGNWLNDASRSRPSWVIATCSRWLQAYGDDVRGVVKRARRTIDRSNSL
jgi:3-methyladenine DNA glycosylase AlkC